MKTKKDKWAGKTIKVDWKHIAKGEEGDEASCPIGLALREQGARDVSVGNNTICIGDRTYNAPKKVDVFVSNFDVVRTDVKPMEFKIGNLIEVEEDEYTGDWL